MIKIVSRWISRCFHPFVTPIYALIIILAFSPLRRIIPIYTQIAVWLATIISAIVLPIIVIEILLHFNVIKHRNLDNREDRAWPLLALGIFMSLASLYTMELPSAEIFTKTFFVVAIQVLIFAIISLYWKISMHAMAWGTICALFLAMGPLFRWAFILSLIIAAIVISSRLVLGKHNSLEVIAGFMQGVLIGIILLTI